MPPAPRQRRSPGDAAAVLSDALGALDRQLASSLSALQEMAQALEPPASAASDIATRSVRDRALPAASTVAAGSGPPAPRAVSAIVPPEDAPPPTLLPVDEVLGRLDRIGPPRTPRPVAPGAATDAAAPMAATGVPRIEPPSLIRPVADVLPSPE